MSGEDLRQRLADFYGVDMAQALPARGALHAKELVIRLVARDGGREVAGAETPALARLAAIYGLSSAGRSSSAAAVFCDMENAQALAQAIVVVDETEIEFSDLKSSIGAAVNVVTIRSLEAAYGLAEAPCATLIASPPMIERLAAMVEPNSIPQAIEKAALDALSPSRLPAAKARINQVRQGRKALADGLMLSPIVRNSQESSGAAVFVEPVDADAFAAIARAWKIDIEPVAAGAFKVAVGSPDANQRILLAFGAAEELKPSRLGEVVRETLETKISAIVDLDSEGLIAIDTSIGFLDHMLTQIAHHAGISATLTCKGDLEVDAHHTIEDCAIAFGQALSQALSARRGIARFGFMLPMDEAEARVSVDLGGRPYLVFDGEFKAPLIGNYPTEMTGHFFRSLSQSLGASIHLSVKGENDHHKTEACFKAFGRALRQAIRIEGDGAPSTKGVI